MEVRGWMAGGTRAKAAGTAALPILYLLFSIFALAPAALGQHVSMIIGPNVHTGGGGGAGGQVIEWFFDEGAGTTTADASGNGYTGTLHNAPAWGTGPNANGDLVFVSASSQYVVTAGNVSQMGGLQHASLSGWIYVASTGVNASFGFSTTGFRFELVNVFTGTLLTICESGGVASYGASSASVGWHHYAVTFDGTQGTPANRVVLYLDGVAQTLSLTGNFPTALDTTANLGPFYAGYDPADSLFSDAREDDVRVYNVTLTPTQVAAIVAAGAQ